MIVANLQTQCEYCHVQAWMRTRGEQGTSVFTADTVAETFGVVEGSYNAVPLLSLDVFQVNCLPTLTS